MAVGIAVKARMKRVVTALKKEYPQALCELDFHNAFEVLVATVLSAQCTDKKVNQVTPQLFGKYPDAGALAEAKVNAVENIIKSLGLYKNKAKNIVAAAGMLVEEYGGDVPDDLDALVGLPGVGRKTANCVLVNAFGKPGIMCDTHCCRVSRRLGLHELSDPVKIEFALGELMPRKEWGGFSHRIIIHGRRVCHARKPDCGTCCLSGWCRYFSEL